MKKYLTLKKLSQFLIIGQLLFTGIVVAKKDTPPNEVEGMLLKEDAKVDLAYVLPDVDWNKFKSVYIRKLSVTDEAKDATPKTKTLGPGHLGESWIIPEKDIELMQKQFTKIMKSSLKKKGINIVSKISDDTLIIIPTIVDIYLNAPIEKTRGTYKTARGALITQGAGSMTISATFADGSNMQVIAYAVDNKYPSTMWSRNTRIQNISDMKRLFYSWGKMLSKSLKKLNIGKQK